MASVAFRRGNDKEKKYLFNFFSVDLNEEFTGLYGQHIMEQTGIMQIYLTFNIDMVKVCVFFSCQHYMHYLHTFEKIVLYRNPIGAPVVMRFQSLIGNHSAALV